jgi:uncharacterized protein YecE (DUF72 family)
VIHLGTSGFSYDDWKAVFYPPEVPSHGRLTYYSSHFGAVELNYTYYRMPTADQLRGLADQTPEGFLFSVKAHQDITHHRRGDPTPFARYRAALLALQREGKLGAVLLQFPNSFRYTADSRQLHPKENLYYLEHCFKQLRDLPLIVEFRSNDWISQRTLSLLREWGVGFCNVDMPKLPGLLPKTGIVTSPTAYVRLHGRNAAKWWKHDKAWERYDYTYEESELAEWVPHLREMDEQAEDVFVFANNHWQGQSIAAVQQLRMLLEGGQGSAE